MMRARTRSVGMLTPAPCPVPALRSRAGWARLIPMPICDEAVSALDVSIRAQILNLLETMKARYRLTLLSSRTISPW